MRIMHYNPKKTELKSVMPSLSKHCVDVMHRCEALYIILALTATDLAGSSAVADPSGLEA